MKRLMLTVALAAIPLVAGAQTTNCQANGNQWSCTQQQQPQVNWNALQTPDFAGGAARAYAAGVAARQGATQAAGPPPLAHWSKDGATQEGFMKDRYECLRESVGPTGQIVGAVALACLEARGYRLDPKGFAPPPELAVPSQ